MADDEEMMEGEESDAGLSGVAELDEEERPRAKEKKSAERESEEASEALRGEDM